MEHHLILTLTGGLTAALILGYFTLRLGLSPIVGYLLAGICIGPHTPGFVGNESLASEMAEVGVILLMFGVGLQFHVKELVAVRRVAVTGALFQIAVATGLGALAGRAFGWGWTGSILFGIAISVASTVVLIRVLTDHGALHLPQGRIAIGWLVVEDLFTVLALVLLPALLAGGGQGLALTLALAVGKLLLLAVILFGAGRRVLPWLLKRVADAGQELFMLAVLVLALMISVGSAYLFGASMALGAFLAGMVIGQSSFATRAASEVLPFRDAFAVLFFVSVGMLLDPVALLGQWHWVAVTLAIILVGKPLAALVVVRALRQPFAVGLAIAVALSQIGEFSFILAVLGRDLGVLPAEGMNILVAASILSITVNPLLYRWAAPLGDWVRRTPALDRWLNPA
jgi:CPA2 family monovalent cation:H+ antiporter-2